MEYRWLCCWGGFVGKKNVTFTNGEVWERHARVVKAAFTRTPLSLNLFSLGRKLFEKMAMGGG